MIFIPGNCHNNCFKRSLTLGMSAFFLLFHSLTHSLISIPSFPQNFQITNGLVVTSKVPSFALYLVVFLWYLTLLITLSLNLLFLASLKLLFPGSPVYLHFFLVWIFFSSSLKWCFSRVIQFFLLPIPPLRHLFCSCSFNQYIWVSDSDFC